MAPAKQLPNTFTALNLLFGCISIALASQDNLTGAGMVIGLSLVLDFMDGFAARALNAASELGKQLDSLSDVVSFGVAPAFILHKMVLQSFPLMEHVGSRFFFLISFLPFILAVFSAIRLARFNLDDDQSHSFKGLPTPASALLVISLPFIRGGDNLQMVEVLQNTYAIIGISVLLSFLLVSGIRLMAFKFRSLHLNENKPQFIFMVIAVLLFILYKFAAIPVVMLIYILISLIFRNELKSSK